MDLKFWIPALGLPLLAVFLNVIVRAINGLSQSALADTVLCFAIFDAVVTIQSEDFGKFVHFIKPDAVQAVFVTLLIINLVGWFLLVVNVEERMVTCLASADTSTKLKGLGFMLLSGVCSTVAIFVSIAPFLLR